MFNIGFDTGKTQDQSRSNWNGDGRRPLAWSAWYPTDAPPAPTVTDHNSDGKRSFIVEDSTPGAELASRLEQYPVVLLSHGTGGTAAGLGWLAERLAKNGFIVLGVDHHGNTGSEAYRAEGFVCWWERARDLSALLDFHATGPFAGRIDPDRIYAAGFSLGGYSVLSLLGGITEMPLFEEWARDRRWGNGPREFPDVGDLVPHLLQTNAVFRNSWQKQSLSFKDRRIKAGLLLAPAPTIRALTVDSLKKIDVPVAIAAVGMDIEAPSDLCAEWVATHLPNNTFTLLEPAAGHYAFLCECTEWGKQYEPEICTDAPGVERHLLHERAAALALDLFT